MAIACITNKGRYVLTKNDPTALTLRGIGVTTAPASQASIDSAAVTSFDHPNDITANELSVSGYSRFTFASLTVTEDDTNRWASFSAAALAAWPSVATGQNFAGIWVVSRLGGSDSDTTDDLLMFLGCTVIPTNGGNLTPVLDANGLYTFA